MKQKIKVAGIQLKHVDGDRDGNLSKASQLVTQNPGFDIYVLPELSSSGYGDTCFNSLSHLSEKDKGPSYIHFSNLAIKQNAFICYSFPRKLQGGKYTIAAVVDPKGDLLGIYEKLHICQFGQCHEKDFFSRGRDLSPVFTVKGVKVGLSICYDIRFPEATRKLVLEQGIHLLLHPGGWPRDEAFATWHPFVITRAMENSIYIMSINSAGDNNGGSIYSPPFIDYKQSCPTILNTAEGILEGIVDLDYLEEIRTTYSFLNDRRADLY